MDVMDGLKTAAAAEGDQKRVRVMEGALKVFLAYGFNRTTMDDIARAAELSRPAVYLIFRNKTDIYRAIARCVVTQIVERARYSLTMEATLLERLDHMVETALFNMVKDIEESPHGAELLDIRNKLAGDIFDEWRGHMLIALKAAFAEEATRNGVDLGARGISPLILAETLLDALEGMKPRLSDPHSHLAAAKGAVRVLVAALRP